MRSDDLTDGRETAETARGGVSGGLNPGFRPPAKPGSASRPSGARSGLPTRRQLLHLIERAERGVLSPAEAALLRHLVVRLLDAPVTARTELAQAREELAAAQQQAAIDRARLDRVLLDAGDVSPVLVECPSCGVPAGQRCRPMRGRRRGLYVEHAPRRRAVGRVVFAEALVEAVAA